MLTLARMLTHVTLTAKLTTLVLCFMLVEAGRASTAMAAVLGNDNE